MWNLFDHIDGGSNFLIFWKTSTLLPRRGYSSLHPAGVAHALSSPRPCSGARESSTPRFPLIDKHEDASPTAAPINNFVIRQRFSLTLFGFYFLESFLLHFKNNSITFRTVLNYKSPCENSIESSLRPHAWFSLLSVIRWCGVLVEINEATSTHYYYLKSVFT